jgi:hypothetical protein
VDLNEGIKQARLILGHLSALPLLGEFAVRNGEAQMLFTILSRQELPSESHVLLVMQLRELISLNFNLFTKSDIETMPEGTQRISRDGEPPNVGG